MALKNCNFCKNDVPSKGQCNQCGFIDGFTRSPSDEEFLAARKVNDAHEYEQFSNLDMLLLSK